MPVKWWMISSTMAGLSLSPPAGADDYRSSSMYAMNSL